MTASCVSVCVCVRVLVWLWFGSFMCTFGGVVAVCTLTLVYMYLYIYIYIYACVCMRVCLCMCVCEAVNLSCPAPSKNTDSPLRRMLQRKITTPTDKHTLVSVQTHTLRQRDEVLHLNWRYSLLFILNVLCLCEIVTWVCVIAVNSKYWLMLHRIGDRLCLRTGGRVQ